MFYKLDWQNKFKAAGAVWEQGDMGLHAAYESATKHSDFYFNTDRVVEDPELTLSVVQSFASYCKKKAVTARWVASYIANVCSGLILAAKLAELLSASFGYVDLRRSLCCFQPRPNDTVLLVIDDIHSGKNLKETIALIEKTGAKIAPLILTMGSFFGSSDCTGIEIFSLFTHEIQSWNMDDCYLCRKGSLALPARQHWQQLIEG